jgi:hypothetical protein
MNSTNKITSLLSQHGFLGSRKGGIPVSQRLVMDEVAAPLNKLSTTVKAMEKANPSEPIQEAAKQLTDCKATVMQSLMQACLQPENPLNLFKSS